MRELYDYILSKFLTPEIWAYFFDNSTTLSAYWRDAREVGADQQALADIKNTCLESTRSTTTIVAISWTRFCGSTPSNNTRRQVCKGSFMRLLSYAPLQMRGKK